MDAGPFKIDGTEHSVLKVTEPLKALNR